MKSVAQRVKKHRDSLRASGLRPIQLWVPDTRKKGFKAECRRQALLLSKDKHEIEVMGWLESVADKDGWK
jgi:hypothetical protein